MSCRCRCRAAPVCGTVSVTVYDCTVYLTDVTVYRIPYAIQYRSCNYGIVHFKFSTDEDCLFRQLCGAGVNAVYRTVISVYRNFHMPVLANYSISKCVSQKHETREPRPVSRLASVPSRCFGVGWLRPDSYVMLCYVRRTNVPRRVRSQSSASHPTLNERRRTRVRAPHPARAARACAVSTSYQTEVGTPGQGQGGGVNRSRQRASVRVQES